MHCAAADGIASYSCPFGHAGGDVDTGANSRTGHASRDLDARGDACAAGLF